MLDGIGKEIKYIVTDDIRCYLTEYQAKKNSNLFLISAMSFYELNGLNKHTTRTATRVYKNAVFDTTEKSLLRHINAEKGLK